MVCAAIFCAFVAASNASAQNGGSLRPAIKAGKLSGPIHIDGVFDEPSWAAAPTIDNLTMREPTAGGTPTARTRVRVLASGKELVIGVECDDPIPDGIVSHTKVRDASLAAEDHVTIVLDTSQDGRYGYVFAVNPGGARYDALIDPGGASENANWDGIWEAATHRDERGWSAEFRIPLATLSFPKDRRTWNFNIERRIQRLQETDRWASPSLDYLVTQTSQAGLLTDLPIFDVGQGWSIRPSVTAGGGIPSPGAEVDGTFQPSIDVTRRLRSNLLGSLTVNTDFAETEVDTRRTNFTRFPLFFPEKRTFFLEGANVFGFAQSLGTALVPYYSRRIGLVNGQEVPIVGGVKINGSAGATNIGMQLVRTGSVDNLTPANTMGVIRLKQNVLDQSSVGMIATFGDPLGRTGSWLSGGDFTFQTSHFLGDKNLAVGIWGLTMGRDGLTGSDRSAEGFLVNFPNDILAFWARYRRVGEDFAPSLGFVERAGTNVYDTKWMYKPRPKKWNIRQMNYEFHYRLWADLSGRLQTDEVFGTPLYWTFESGDAIELDTSINRERLEVPFKVADGIVLHPGEYRFTRHRIDAITASKRALSAEFAWWFGQFYDGTLHQLTITGAWNPTPLVTVEFSAERDIGHLSPGHFTEDLLGTRLRFNVSSDLQVSSYLQYDTVSKSFGTNNRLRWTIRTFGDLFVIYNHNIRDIQDRWQLDSNQILVKFQYAFRR